LFIYFYDISLIIRHAEPPAAHASCGRERDAPFFALEAFRPRLLARAVDLLLRAKVHRYTYYI